MNNTMAIPRTVATVTARPPSGPKAPPEIQGLILSPAAVWIRVTLPELPDTSKPKTLPWVKFQKVWAAQTIQILSVKYAIRA